METLSSVDQVVVDRVVRVLYKKLEKAPDHIKLNSLNDFKDQKDIPFQALFGQPHLRKAVQKRLSEKWCIKIQPAADVEDSVIYHSIDFDLKKRKISKGLRDSLLVLIALFGLVVITFTID